ncbi:MAG: hypothetical protein J3Q66DRAFT_329840 [Benniella sp.]|nr:MAG: hypothetical protein J3Q66DRAFT_329840 [Benniella sp.]
MVRMRMAVAVPGVGVVVVVVVVMGIATAWEMEWIELMLRIVIHVENKPGTTGSRVVVKKRDTTGDEWGVLEKK